MSGDGLRTRVAELVGLATAGGVRPVDALEPDASLSALGLDSLALLRLVDAIEREYGVEIDAGGGDRRIVTLDDVVDRIVRAGAA